MGAPCGASYLSSLCGSDRKRYEDKTELCGADPFDPGVRYVANVDLWPRVDKCDIMDFLVLRTSFVSRKQLKAYKSMDGHNYVTSGWVQEPLLKQVSADTVIVITQVSARSQIARFCRILRPYEKHQLSELPVLLTTRPRVAEFCFFRRCVVCSQSRRALILFPRCFILYAGQPLTELVSTSSQDMDFGQKRWRSGRSPLLMYGRQRRGVFPCRGPAVLLRVRRARARRRLVHRCRQQLAPAARTQDRSAASGRNGLFVVYDEKEDS